MRKGRGASPEPGPPAGGETLWAAQPLLELPLTQHREESGHLSLFCVPVPCQCLPWAKANGTATSSDCSLRDWFLVYRAEQEEREELIWSREASVFLEKWELGAKERGKNGRWLLGP